MRQLGKVMGSFLLSLALLAGGITVVSGTNAMALQKDGGCYSEYRNCCENELNKPVSQCLDELMTCILDGIF